MNYVVLNGVKSNTIKGLLIQSLPPVSKPLMRTQVEQIDGRDGDIVTNLGYSSYNKKMKIGLHGDFDIDDVIAYFDSAGTVTFSNEPGKYYNYQIIEQIDFERLLRFREATVTFHVQPFKYAAIGDDVQVTAEKYAGVPNFTDARNGLTVTATGGTISIKGTATAATEVYMPVNAISLAAGSYVLSLTANGTGATACSVRLIGTAPSNADSFGGNYVTLKNNDTASITATLTGAKIFKYLWFYIAPNTAINLTLGVSILGDGTSTTLVNLGNTISKPTIRLCGSGDISLSINGNEILTLNLGYEQYITIDAAAMNAYDGELLLNRSVTGDYNNVVLQPGTNTLSWSGNVLSVEVSKVSRWI